MRNGCSRDLLDPAHLIRDFDVVWLEVRCVRSERVALFCQMTRARC
jgi:hypothetical protein